MSNLRLYARMFLFTMTIVLCLFPAAKARRDIILELAGGLTSPVIPFSSRWGGAVQPGGLYCREFAARGTYEINEIVSARVMIGWLEDYSQPRYCLMPPPDLFPRPVSFRDVFYLVPSFLVSLRSLRLGFGAVIYGENIAGHDYWYDEYPLNGSHRFKPSMNFELGEKGAYIFGRFSDAFPLISGGGIMEAGIGGRTGKVYEHEVSCSLSGYHQIGLGYRGEIRFVKQTALSFGFVIGGKDHDNVYVMTLGIKTVIPGR